MCKFKSAREQLISVRIEVCLSNEKRRLGKSESHWPRLTILLAKYSARASALHCNGSPKPNAPGYVPRYDPRGHFVKNFIRHWQKRALLELICRYNIVRTLMLIILQSLLSHPEKVLTRSGLTAKSNFEYRSVFVTVFQCLLEARSFIQLSISACS